MFQDFSKLLAAKFLPFRQSTVLNMANMQYNRVGIVVVLHEMAPCILCILIIGYSRYINHPAN